MPPAPRHSINLLSQDDFSTSMVGKVLLWALSIGRYIVVFTELIVILSFLSRFKLDRDLTDLNEGINRQKAIIQSYGNLEPQFRQLQQQLQFLRDSHPVYPLPEFLVNVSKITSPDVKLSDLTIQDKALRISGSALNSQSFNSFIKNLSLDPQLKNISIDRIYSEDQGNTITFDLQAQMVAKKKAGKL